MASGFFLLLDDIATLADDVAVATKTATKQTAGILGDDIAVSAQQATGFSQEHELKVIWKIIKGSLRNKLIILPIALLVSYYFPLLVTYALIAGALFLLYEGVHKVLEYIQEKYFHKQREHHNKDITEDAKVKSSILTDFILSIEIIIMALGAVTEQSFFVQVGSVASVAILATFGVYGLVAAIVRIDNLGFYLINKNYIKSGNFLISLMPKMIKMLTVLGTFAMLLVGGDILLHHIELLHHNINPTIVNTLLVGFFVGVLILVVFNGFTRLRKKSNI